MKYGEHGEKIQRNKRLYEYKKTHPDIPNTAIIKILRLNITKQRFGQILKMMKEKESG